MSTHDVPVTSRIRIPRKHNRFDARGRWKPSGCDRSGAGRSGSKADQGDINHFAFQGAHDGEHLHGSSDGGQFPESGLRRGSVEDPEPAARTPLRPELESERAQRWAQDE